MVLAASCDALAEERIPISRQVHQWWMVVKLSHQLAHLPDDI